MKILSVVGARPNFMKIAPIISAINAYNLKVNNSMNPTNTMNSIDHVLVHTGQHYDGKMSKLFFDELKIPKPDYNLEVGSGSHAYQTAEIMKRFEEVLLKEMPNVVIVVGDVNSTIACALVSSKIEYSITQLTNQHNKQRPLVAHVEAGLRSFDRTMPEEVNRVLTDHISDFLFVTEPSGIENLKNEGFKNFLDNYSPFTNHQSLPLVAYVGNVMIDTLLKHKEKAIRSDVLSRIGIDGKPYGVITLHRPSNVDYSDIFEGILSAFKEISKNLPVIFPAHPRTQARIKEFGFEKYFNFLKLNNSTNAKNSINSINIIDPLGYLDFLKLMSNAKVVLTDSGGIQEETTILGIPCITIRENTERPVTVTEGTNTVVGTDKELIIKESLNKLNQLNKPKKPHLWDGKAATRIVSILAKKLISK